MLDILRRYFYMTEHATLDREDKLSAVELYGDRIYSGKLLWFESDGMAALSGRDGTIVKINPKHLFKSREELYKSDASIDI